MEDTELDSIRIQEIFDLFDTESRGFIPVQKFVEVATEHLGSLNFDASCGHESIAKIIDVLDPGGDGEIYFAQFQEGVRQILKIKALSSPSADIGDHSEVYLDQSAHSLNNEKPVGKKPSRGSPTSVKSNLSGHFGISGPPTDDVDSGVSCRQCASAPAGPYSSDLLMETGSEFVETSLFRSTRHTQPAVNCLHSSPMTMRRTPSAIASHHCLPVQKTHSHAGGRSSSSNVVLDDIDGSFVQINDKVKGLEDQIRLLNETQLYNDEKHSRIKEENSQMIDRVHYLEEQLHEMELQSFDQLLQEQKRNRELMMRLEREKSAELELLMQSYTHIEQEYNELKSVIPSLRAENERLTKENARRSAEIDRLSQQLFDLGAECNDIRDKLYSEQQNMARERHIHAQLVEELGRELEELRGFKSKELNHVTADEDSASLEQWKNVCSELEEMVSGLRQENSALRDQIEDVRSQLMCQHIDRESSLRRCSVSDLDSMSHDEMLATLRQEQEANQTLRTYVEQITLRILENNPSILEISSSSRQTK